MERAIPQESFWDRLLISLRGNLPAVIVLGFTLLLAIAIAVEAGPYLGVYAVRCPDGVTAVNNRSYFGRHSLVSHVSPPFASALALLKHSPELRGIAISTHVQP